VTPTLVRGRYVFVRPLGRERVETIADGAVLVVDGRIAALGEASALAARHPDAVVLGSDDHVVLPGFVNAHHHIGLTPIQLGVRDAPLELWFVTRMAARDVDPYLDTLYSAFEMLRSGVTTVQHIFGWPRGSLIDTERRIRRIIDAYRDVGMRVSFALGVRDQNYFTYEPEPELLARLPRSLRVQTADLIRDLRFPLAEQLALYRDLDGRYRDDALVKVQLAPGNLHWCSDAALTEIHDCCERTGALLHVHLVETAYQREYARRRTGGPALRHLHRFELTGSRLTLGHGTWLDEADIALAAETGTLICHNCSSNLRLRSGIAPLNDWAGQGLHVALGIDEAGINDDRDMLQEMRLALHLHRTPGMEERVPTPEQIFAMATRNGARTTPFGDTIGTLETGRAADLVLLRWSAVAYPYLDPEMPPLAGVLHRATAAAVDTVLIGGKPIVVGGEIQTIDRQAILAELAASLARPLTSDEAARREFVERLFPFVRKFYEGYVDLQRYAPFYRSNAR
jgi:cytosine/adenosine deaminase-related metal-dependent hydrolase